jgi:WD repeat and SOF domain-containing protein 1
LRAAKLGRHFAKPFIGALEGHVDGIYCMATSPLRLSTLVSGACDGEIRVWDLPSKKLLWNAKSAHTGGFVRGLSIFAGGESFVSCGVSVYICADMCCCANTHTPLVF